MATTARAILAREYGDSTNMMTPTVMQTVTIRHPETGEIGAAEIAMGDSLRLREHEKRGVMPRVYAVSVVWMNADGETRRMGTDEDGEPVPFGSRLFFDEVPERDWWTSRAQSAAYRAAKRYVRSLGGKVNA